MRNPSRKPKPTNLEDKCIGSVLAKTLQNNTFPQHSHCTIGIKEWNESCNNAYHLKPVLNFKISFWSFQKEPKDLPLFTWTKSKNFWLQQNDHDIIRNISQDNPLLPRIENHTSIDT